MKLNNQIQIQGRVCLQHFDQNHNLIKRIEQPNLITNVGRLFFANKIMDLSDSIILDKIGIGDGQTTPTLDDENLEAADSYGSGNYAYADIRFKQAINNSIEKGIFAEAVFPAGTYSEQTVSEIGLFTSTEDPYTNEPTEMIARTILSGANQFDKADGDYLSVAWNIILG